jgi:hypothetical protein
VPYAALVHGFWLDNRPCVADIADLRKDGIANDQECQFMSGDVGTLFSVGFVAGHYGQPAGGTGTFMSSYTIWWHRGLNGPSATMESGNTNHPSPLSTTPVSSTSVSFGSLLGHQKCTFAVNLAVYPKHTNGIGTLSGYAAHDQAAFALDVSP